MAMQFASLDIRVHKLDNANLVAVFNIEVSLKTTLPIAENTPGSLVHEMKGNLLGKLPCTK